MPFISIIIPTRNPNRRIFRCIRSIRQQDYKNVEIIIHDNSNRILSRLFLVLVKLQMFSSLKLFFKKDKCVYEAMNNAIKKSKGTWIYILGSDDYISSNNILGDVAESLMHANARFVYGNVQGNHLGAEYDGIFTLEKLAVKNICQQAIFYHRQLFDKLGYFDESEPVFADWDFNLRSFCDLNSIKRHVNITIAHYADGGLSAIHNDAVFRDSIQDRMNRYSQCFGHGAQGNTKIG